MCMKSAILLCKKHSFLGHADFAHRFFIPKTDPKSNQQIGKHGVTKIDKFGGSFVFDFGADFEATSGARLK